MGINIENLPFIVIVKILSCCNPEDIFTVIQAIPAFKKAYLLSSHFVQKCDLSNYYPWHKKDLKFAINFIKISKNIREINVNYLPREIVQTALKMDGLVKLSILGYKLDFDETNTILTFPKLEEFSFDFMDMKPYYEGRILLDGIPTFNISLSIQRLHIFLAKEKTTLEMALMQQLIIACRNIKHMFLSSISIKEPTRYLWDVLRKIRENPELFANHKHITFGEETSVNTCYFHEYHSWLSNYVGDGMSLMALFHVPYDNECVRFLCHKSLLFASLKAVQVIKHTMPEVKEVIVHSNGFFTGVQGRRVLNERQISHLFPLLPSVESLHCFSNCKLDYELFLSCYPRLKDLTLSCRRMHTNGNIRILCNFIAKLTELKSLTVPTCILKDFSVMRKRKHGVKRRRLNKDKDDIPFIEILKSCKDLQRLEICQLTAQEHCNSYYSVGPPFVLQGSTKERCYYGGDLHCIQIPVRWEGLEHIANLHQLQHLQLCKIPLYQDKLLITIADGCPLLISLKLKCIGPDSSKCTYVKDLCEALKLLNNLQDFSWEQDFIFPCSKIFQILKFHCPKLRRIYMKNVMDNRYLDSTTFLNFIVHAPRLRFAFFVFKISHNLRGRVRSYIQSRAPPHLIWDVQMPNDKYDNMKTAMPPAFNGEMCLFRPHVLNRLMHLN